MDAIDTVPATALAGLPRRLVAVVFDVVVFLPATVAFLVLMSLPNGGDMQLDGTRALVFFGGWLLLWESTWGAAGGTPGKRIAGFTVRRIDGSRLGLARGLVRTAVKYGQLWFPLLLFVSAGMIARTARAQAIHDLVAGSVCLERSAMQQLHSPQARGAAHASSSDEPPALEPSSPHGGPFL